MQVMLPAPDASRQLPALAAPEGHGLEEQRLEEYITDRQIETLALRALTRFAGLVPEEADRQWEEWRRELYVRFPPYAAAEVERRADELRGLSK